MPNAAMTPVPRTRARKAQGTPARLPQLPEAPVPGTPAAPLAASTVAQANSLILTTTEVLQAATDALAAAEPRLQPLIQQHGLPERLLAKDGSYFVALAKSICFQQLAISAASAIFKRFLATCGAETKDDLTPAKVLAVDMAQLRACGLSERKASYLQDLARHYQEGHLSDELLAAADDAQLVEALTRVKGIGAWTAHMFEMFSLGKSDILPVGDLGVRKGFQVLFGLKSLPSPEEMAQLSEHWRPYRSVGCYYMWQMPTTPASPAERRKAAAAPPAATPTPAGTITTEGMPAGAAAMADAQTASGTDAAAEAAVAADTGKAADAAIIATAPIQAAVAPVTPPLKRQRKVRANKAR